MTIVAFAAAGVGPARAQESQLDTLRTAAKGAPSDALAALALGRALRRAGHPALALTELRRGIAVSGGKVDAMTKLYWEVARVQMDRRDFSQTLIACQILGKLPGATAEGHACTADAYLLWQRSSEALVEVHAALGRDPRSFEAKLAEGRANEFALDAAKAEAAYREAVALRPDSVEARTALGRTLWKNGSRDDGVAELRRALQSDPSAPDALYELALALPPGQESMGLFDRATRERPSFAEAWLALGTQQLALGRLGEAKRSAEAAEHSDRGSVAAKILSGKIALAEGRADDAIRAGEGALAIVGNSAAAKLLVADGNAKKGEIDRALEAYQAAWGLDHGDPTPLVHASQACHAAGRDTSARAFGAKAVQEFPAWAPGWAALADALAAEGETAEAKDAYHKALSAHGPVDRAAIESRLGALR
jgi:tetratricopeptide (TPR) repeat protein